MISRNLRFDFRSKLPKNTLSFPSFNLRYEKNGLGKLQLGVVVSKKVDKRAVIRNKIKRKVLDILQKEVGEDSALSIVYYAKKQVIDDGVLEKEIKESLDKIKNV